MLNFVKLIHGLSRDPKKTWLPAIDGLAPDGLAPIRQWLNGLEIRNRALAHFICYVIPAQCPFERKIRVFNQVLYIPPLCKLNPLYEEVLGLRFRALSYLADECQIDIHPYC